MSNHFKSLCVAAPSEQRAKERYEARVKYLADLFDQIVREELPFALDDLKGDQARKPYPEPRQLFSDTLRGHAKPGHSFGDFFARLIADGMSYFDARCFAAKVSMKFVDQVYADSVPSLAELGPRLIKEQGDVAAQLVVTAHDPSEANLTRTLDEAREVEVISAITAARALNDRNQKHHLRNVAVTRLSPR